MRNVNIKPVRTVVVLSPEKQNKVKSNAASELADFTITAKVEIIQLHRALVLRLAFT